MEKSKTPSDGALLGRTSAEVFVGVVSSFHFHFIFVSSFCCYCIFISFSFHFLIFNLLFLFFVCRCSSFTFTFRQHSSPFRGLSLGFYTHFILSVQPIAEWFTILSFQIFCDLLITSATVLSGHFLSTGVFYLMLHYWHFWLNLHLLRLSWEPTVLPWSLHGFILFLETQTPAHLFVWFTEIHNLHTQNNSVLNSIIY